MSSNTEHLLLVQLKAREHLFGQRVHGGQKIKSFVLLPNCLASLSTRNVQWEQGLTHSLVITSKRGSGLHPPAFGDF